MYINMYFLLKDEVRSTNTKRKTLKDTYSLNWSHYKVKFILLAFVLSYLKSLQTAGLKALCLELKTTLGADEASWCNMQSWIFFSKGHQCCFQSNVYWFLLIGYLSCHGFMIMTRLNSMILIDFVDFSECVPRGCVSVGSAEIHVQKFRCGKM